MKDMLRMQDGKFLRNKLSLEEFQRQFEHWRKDRKLREELKPEQLREAAVCLSQDYFISKISQALRLTDLKLTDLKLKNLISKRNKMEILKPVKKFSPCPFFVELALHQRISIPQSVGEMEKSKAAKMKIQLKRGKFEFARGTKNIFRRGS